MNPDTIEKNGSSAKVVATIVIFILVAGTLGWLIGKSGDDSKNMEPSNSTNSQSSGATLDLSGQQLTTIPESALNRTDITTLNLSNNQLTGLPADITKMTNLQVLNVENNRLESLPSEISQLASLREILANNNRMTSIPAGLENMTQLKILDISGNNIPMSQIDQLKTKLTNTEVKN